MKKNEVLITKVESSQIEELLNIQKACFKKLFDKYKDVDTNPYAEDLAWITVKFNRPHAHYYFIKNKEEVVGYFRVDIFDETPTSARIAIIGVVPEHENNGYAKTAMRLIEEENPQVSKWQIETIKQEDKLVHLYSNLGYELTGKVEPIKDGMDIVYLEKHI
ncbi:hypothetical protein BG261_01705 [Floricoccus tropicus]|uniref:N-acetyltransferase domain-containing protein n=1 Tax=Floricoccus tropicus TaxID=1859473 RepID=A0A1E8GNX5_9LACT|nr:GNAT family N-acetyltransferase [Floricoccus tropicus]OFI49323.1 hypothetical protein BG261_01705 [Floricoccus tropicus]